METTTGKPSAIWLLISDRNGVYIPQTFVRDFDLNVYSNISPKDAVACSDIDHVDYWDAWDSILRTATLTLPEGHTYRLHQDGDLWLYCEELMTDDEYLNLFGEPREPAATLVAPEEV